MTRLWAAGTRIAVLADVAGLPQGFTWEARSHTVQLVLDRWRVDVEWWRWRAWREYFRLATRTGLLVVVYHDLVEDRWYLQRVYD